MTMEYSYYHWTDTASAPVFTTRIKGGNIYAMVGEAVGMLRHLDIPHDRITKLQSDVKDAPDYGQAVAFIEHWFPVDR